MPDDTVIESPAELSAAAMAEWNDHVEQVLRGVAHSLHNRAAALSAVFELSAEPAEKPTSLHGIIGEELSRVTDLAKVVRLIGAPRVGAEAIAPRDALADVRAILDLHAEHQDAPARMDANGAPAIRVHRWMFLRAIIGLAVATQRGRRAGVALTMRGDGPWLVVLTDAPTDAPRSALVTELARAMGGEPLSDQVGFRIPTLAALRQREGR